MHLTSDYLRSDHGFDVHQVFADGFRLSAWHSGAARFLQPWEAAGVIQRAVDRIGECDLVEVHEPLLLGLGLLHRLRRRPFKLIAFSYGLEERGIASMIEYRREHSIGMSAKSRLGCVLQTLQTSAGVRLADHVICSNFDDVRYLTSRRFPGHRVSRHFSGVDDDLLDRARAAPASRGPGVLFVGSWIERKGIREIAAALPRVLESCPGSSLTIAGCRSPASGVLEAFPEHLRARIRVIERMDSNETLAAVYASHRVLVLPSYFEGQPLAMMEAAAFGLSIVTTPVSGMLDFIRDGENGLFAPVGDSAALAGQVERLLRDDDLARALGSAVRRDVEHHTWRDSARNLAAIYTRARLSATANGSQAA